MDRAGILASLCFPTLPRFCGQLFMEASDREFGFVCLQAYNDWMIEEWCGAAPGRYIPLMLIPMWDPQLAVEEMERCAAKGATTFAFSENPAPLGLPTIHDTDRYWDPVMAAANELEHGRVDARRLVVAGAADRARLAVHGQPRLGCDPHLGGDAVVAVQRHVPALPEPEDRAVRGRDRLDARTSSSGPSRSRQAAALGEEGPEVHGPRRPPTSTSTTSTSGRPFRDHIFGCFIEDHHGIASLDEIGEDNMMCETDYPHSDSTWPELHRRRAAADRRTLPERRSTRCCAATPSGSTASRRPSRRCCACLTRARADDRRRPRALHGQRHVHRLRARHVRARRRDQGDRHRSAGDPLDAVRNAVEACPTGA